MWHIATSLIVRMDKQLYSYIQLNLQDLQEEEYRYYTLAGVLQKQGQLLATSSMFKSELTLTSQNNYSIQTPTLDKCHHQSSNEKRKKLYNKTKRSRSPFNWNQYKNTCNTVNQSLKQAYMSGIVSIYLMTPLQ